jgi:hypothetical protein
MFFLAIPTFGSSSSDPTRSAAETRHKDGKPDAVKRPRRGGVGGGSTGLMSEN